MSGLTHAAPIAGAVTGTALMAPHAADPAQAALAYTGLALGLYLVIAGALLGSGLALRALTRRMARHRS